MRLVVSKLLSPDGDVQAPNAAKQGNDVASPSRMGDDRPRPR